MTAGVPSRTANPCLKCHGLSEQSLIKGQGHGYNDKRPRSKPFCISYLSALSKMALASASFAAFSAAFLASSSLCLFSSSILSRLLSSSSILFISRRALATYECKTPLTGHKATPLLLKNDYDDGR